MFLPDCHVCICSEGFDNSTTVGNKYCHKIECGFELNHLHKLKRGCIPYYTPDPVCCPEEDFRCRKLFHKFMKFGLFYIDFLCS